MMNEIKITGKFDRQTLAEMHKKNPFKVGDILVSRKGERFEVVKIFSEPKHIDWTSPTAIALLNGNLVSEGFDIVGLEKGKVFTIYMR